MAITNHNRIKIFHIVHYDRLPSIIQDGYIWCDAEVIQRTPPGTTIGMNSIKQRRLYELTLNSFPDLHVGDCVPFYFCPRSVMLFMIYKADHPDLAYRGGQEPIIHLEADINEVVNWAQFNHLRWAFTLSNAGSRYFEDRCDLANLTEINWAGVNANFWTDPILKEGKQAEILIEHRFPWNLIERIGVYSRTIFQRVTQILPANGHRPRLEIRPEWYY
jgi:hypothetical protein